MSASLIKYKGLADILVAVILIFEPSLIYESVVAKQLHIWSGLHLSDASTAPGFNHSLACMVAAVGVAHIVAARSGAGPEARSIIFSMNVTWAILGLLTSCWALLSGTGNAERQAIGSATGLMTTLNHAVFSLILWWRDPEALRVVGRGPIPKKIKA